MWLDAVRALAAAHVRIARQRWHDLGRPACVHDAVDEILARTGAGAAELPEAGQARAALAADPRWRRLRAELGLTMRDVDLLALVTACELDPGLTRVLGYLDDSAVPAPPTPANTALLWGWPAGAQPGPASALLRWRLAVPAGPWQRTTAWTVDGAIAAYLAGADDWTDFDGAVRISGPDGPDCLHPELLDRMRHAVTTLGAVEVELTGAPGTGRRTLLVQLAAALGHRAVVGTGDDPLPAVRAARLLDGVPVLVEAEPPPAAGDRPVFLARRCPAPAGRPEVPRLSWAMPYPDRAARHRLWAAGTPETAPALVTEWELSPADVAVGAAVAAAGQQAARAAIGQRLRTAAGAPMTALELPYDWDDLIIGEPAAGQLHRLRNQVRYAREVLDDWEFARLSPQARGITALFAGPSGTGKTMAAQVLARTLGLELYKVDLAEVVDKYIGETEKRLEQVFAECERSRTMVFFDEADALFGQRTKVRDAHDRYANIEIDYLLQRLDTFRGVAVLATNRKSDLDPAFLRRLRIVVDFAAPAASERLRMWERALPARTSAGRPLTGDLDRAWLAEHLELTGAEIAAVALNAAFEARAGGDRIGAGHVLDAARREVAKRGGVVRLDMPVAVTR